jgi:hypothetical protein
VILHSNQRLLIFIILCSIIHLEKLGGLSILARLNYKALSQPTTPLAYLASSPIMTRLEPVGKAIMGCPRILNQAVILYLDITFHQPTGYSLGRANVYVTLLHTGPIV